MALPCLALTPGAQVILVPREVPTIRAALAAARPGTTIQVAPGTYSENLIWPGVDGIRLVSEAGHEKTILDGGLRGRVIQFGPGLTRATLLQGFTLTNGSDGEGGGVYVGSSPTLLFNRIMGCRGEDVLKNRGGGIYVEAYTSPRIERNLILGNVLDKGRTNEGAGMYVADGAFPEILSNLILNNVCKGPDQARGGGIHFGLTGTPSAVVSSNVIAGNKVDGSLEGRGGGVNVEGGTTVLINNTLADNSCISLVRAVGGGLHMGKTGAAGSRIHNNIVVRNSVSASVRFGGGIHCEGVTPAIDFNDVWGNTGGDYYGCAPGLNDIARDPVFLGLGDYHLNSLSPCVDAGSNSLVPAVSVEDSEGDPRILDGNLDGLLGNGARVEMGGDEITGVGLSLTGIPGPGARVTFNVLGPAGTPCFLVSSFRPDSTFINPFGSVLVGFPAVVMFSGSAPATVPFQIPFINALAGTRVYTQGLVARMVGGNPVGQLTNRLDMTLIKRFSRPIVEGFHNTHQMEPGVTTAAWTLRGKPGLHATLGYGGSGNDGPIAVYGQRVLDSSTRTPNPGGVVEWNFSSLEIAHAGALRLKGPYPIRLNVLGDCRIEGTLDASGLDGLNGPPGRATVVGRVPGGEAGPGGGAGGLSNAFPNNPIGALPMELRGGPGYPRAQVCGNINKSENRLITVVEPNCGGGTGGNRGMPMGTILRSGCSGNGGGHATKGIQTDYLCSNIGAYGREPTINWIVATGPNGVLSPTAGTGGGGGGNAAITTGNPSPKDGIVAGGGGGGGGGVEIVTAGRLRVGPTGVILARGGDGGFGHTTLTNTPLQTIQAGFGGGGAGGSIWLSGTSVTVQAQATVHATGGLGNPNPPVPGRSGNGGDGYVLIRDVSGNPTVSSNNIVPAPVQGRSKYTPVHNGKSFAYSRWYPAGGANPQWAFDASNPQTGLVIPGNDLTFQAPPTTGQKVFIAWQGAPDLNGAADPNPATWIPAGNTMQNPFAKFENDIQKMRGGKIRHIRFFITFDLGPVTVPPPPQVVVSKVQINY